MECDFKKWSSDQIIFANGISKYPLISMCRTMIHFGYSLIRTNGMKWCNQIRHIQTNMNTIKSRISADYLRCIHITITKMHCMMKFFSKKPTHRKVDCDGKRTSNFRHSNHAMNWLRFHQQPNQHGIINEKLAFYKAF